MTELATRIHDALDEIGALVVACSGGIDSLLLALVAHRRAPREVIVAHATSPAVPPEATERVRRLAAAEAWDLRVVQSGEFGDPAYLANPVNRCYFCKSNLYSSLEAIADGFGAAGAIVSGANVDDLGEYRPGLIAAAEKGVRHPWIEAAYDKRAIRVLARELDLDFAELPASPCLASRLYTGTAVTAGRLRSVHACETLVRSRTGVEVVRCRVRGSSMLIEVPIRDRARIDANLVADVASLARSIDAGINYAALDSAPYRAGRAFVGAAS